MGAQPNVDTPATRKEIQALHDEVQCAKPYITSTFLFEECIQEQREKIDRFLSHLDVHTFVCPVERFRGKPQTGYKCTGCNSRILYYLEDETEAGQRAREDNHAKDWCFDHILGDGHTFCPHMCNERGKLIVKARVYSETERPTDRALHGDLCLSHDEIVKLFEEIRSLFVKL